MERPGRKRSVFVRIKSVACPARDQLAGRVIAISERVRIVCRRDELTPAIGASAYRLVLAKQFTQLPQHLRFPIDGNVFAWFNRALNRSAGRSRRGRCRTLSHCSRTREFVSPFVERIARVAAHPFPMNVPCGRLRVEFAPQVEVFAPAPSALSLWTVTSIPGGKARSAWIAAVISIRLLVVEGSAPESSRCEPSAPTISTPHPPGPGLPRQEPSA